MMPKQVRKTTLMDTITVDGKTLTQIHMEFMEASDEAKRILKKYDREFKLIPLLKS
jgi:hypothetical protein